MQGIQETLAILSTRLAEVKAILTMLTSSDVSHAQLWPTSVLADLLPENIDFPIVGIAHGQVLTLLPLVCADIAGLLLAWRKHSRAEAEVG